MTATTYCDVSGLRMLANLTRYADASQATLRIVILPGSSIRRSLAILGVNASLPLYPSIQDATAPS